MADGSKGSLPATQAFRQEPSLVQSQAAIQSHSIAFNQSASESTQHIQPQQQGHFVRSVNFDIGSPDLGIPQRVVSPILPVPYQAVGGASSAQGTTSLFSTSPVPQRTGSDLRASQFVRPTASGSVPAPSGTPPSAHLSALNVELTMLQTQAPQVAFAHPHSHPPSPYRNYEQDQGTRTPLRLPPHPHQHQHQSAMQVYDLASTPVSPISYISVDRPSGLGSGPMAAGASDTDGQGQVSSVSSPGVSGIASGLGASAGVPVTSAPLDAVAVSAATGTSTIGQDSAYDPHGQLGAYKNSPRLANIATATQSSAASLAQFAEGAIGPEEFLLEQEPGAYVSAGPPAVAHNISHKHISGSPSIQQASSDIYQQVQAQDARRHSLSTVTVTTGPEGGLATAVTSDDSKSAIKGEDALSPLSAPARTGPIAPLPSIGSVLPSDKGAAPQSATPSTPGPSSTGSSQATPRQSISLQTKLDIIDLARKTTISQQEIALRYQISRPAVTRILKRKQEFLNLASSQQPLDVSKRCRLQKGKFEDLEKRLYDWYSERKAMGHIPSGNGLQEQAMKMAEDSGEKHSFKASNGWLEGFKKRYGISGKRTAAAVAAARSAAQAAAQAVGTSATSPGSVTSSANGSADTLTMATTANGSGTMVGSGGFLARSDAATGHWAGGLGLDIKIPTTHFGATVAGVSSPGPVQASTSSLGGIPQYHAHQQATAVRAVASGHQTISGAVSMEYEPSRDKKVARSVVRYPTQGQGNVHSPQHPHTHSQHHSQQQYQQHYQQHQAPQESQHMQAHKEGLNVSTMPPPVQGLSPGPASVVMTPHGQSPVIPSTPGSSGQASTASSRPSLSGHWVTAHSRPAPGITGGHVGQGSPISATALFPTPTPTPAHLPVQPPGHGASRDEPPPGQGRIHEDRPPPQPPPQQQHRISYPQMPMAAQAQLHASDQGLQETMLRISTSLPLTHADGSRIEGLGSYSRTDIGSVDDAEAVGMIHTLLGYLEQRNLGTRQDLLTLFRLSEMLRRGGGAAGGVSTGPTPASQSGAPEQHQIQVQQFQGNTFVRSGSAGTVEGNGNMPRSGQP